MNQITLQHLQDDPELLDRMIRAAHRERSRALGDALVRLARHLIPRFDFHPAWRNSLEQRRRLAFREEIQ